MRPAVSLRIIFPIFLLFSITAVVHAQFKGGIEGTVTDPTGAVVPGATVTVTNTETGKTQETLTSDEGFYRVTGLAPGRYRVSVELSGFKKKVVENVAVNAEDVRGVNLALETGELTTSVTVEGEALPALQTENANIAGAITTDEIRRLPQVGRDPYELIRLAPGVFGDGARSGSGSSVGLPNTTGPGGSNTSVFQVENQVPITANGQRLSANNYQIDGVSVNSLTWGGAAVVTPNQESVKEMRVVSSSYSAEDGRNSGAQIKVVSQNGTNLFHGSALFKYNDPGLNAFNKYGGFFGAPPVRVNQRFRQYGGSLGGPVVKDKLFFFFSYEGLRNITSDTFNQFVETPEYRQLVRNLRPGGITAKIFSLPGMEPRIIKVLPVDCSAFGNDPKRCNVVSGGLDIGSPTGSLGSYVSLGNPAGGGLDGIPDIQFAQLAIPNKVRGNQYNTRFDYDMTENDHFAVSTYFTHRDDILSDSSSRSRPSSDLTFTPLNSAVTLTYNRIFSGTTLNEARFNFTRFAANQVISSKNTNFGIPRIEVEGLPFDRIRFGAPRAETTPGIFAQNTFEFRDTLGKVFRNHGMKYGVEVRKEEDNNNLVGGARPLYSFSGLFNLANDAPIFESINADPRTGSTADIQRYFRTSAYALFVQDDWKFRPNLTLNLGLRWEYFTPLKERRGQLSNLIFGSKGLADSRVVVVDEFFKPDRNNFAPRLGFAWGPRRLEDKLVVRGGFGVSYNRTPNVVLANARGNPPFLVRYNICCGTASTDFGTPFKDGLIAYTLGSSNSPFSFPPNLALAQGIDPATGGPRADAAEVYGTGPELPNAYVYSFSLDTEYRLPQHLVAAFGYQGSSGHKLIRLVNQNFLFPPNPKFFAVYFARPDVNSNYHALIARLTREFSRGLQMEGVYRFSKSIDNLSYEGPGAETNQTYPQDLRSERGPSDFDVRHHFILSGLWDIPIFRGRSDFVGKAFGGWQINGVWTAHTGFPWTAKTGLPVSTPGGATLSPSRP
ncbi:MAG TPA: TonB-dependent receptor, partial [Acidobacteriota bacterium]